MKQFVHSEASDANVIGVADFKEKLAQSVCDVVFGQRKMSTPLRMSIQLAERIERDIIPRLIARDFASANLDRTTLHGAVDESLQKAFDSAGIGNGQLLAINNPATIEWLKIIDESLPRIRHTISERNIERLVEVLAETHDPMARVNAEIDTTNAVARQRFMNNFICLTSEDVTQAAGSTARNRSQTASRWKAEGKTFSTPWRGQEVYPAFQFKDGRPLAVIARILSALPDAMSAWETAFWFVSTNSWLDDTAPFKRLHQPERVVAVAVHEAEVVEG